MLFNVTGKGRPLLHCPFAWSRAPLLDFDLIEFTLALPFSRIYDNPKWKGPLRSWARGKLPQKILDRPKKGFSIPLTHWLSGPPCLHLTVGQFLAGKNDHNRINKPSKQLILRDFRRFLLPIMAFGSQHLDKTKCYDKTFPVEYTPKPLNNKASPVFDLSSQKLSNSKGGRG